jgi:hypothetical protein
MDSQMAVRLSAFAAFDFCCGNDNPDGRDAQAWLTDHMVYQRHVGRFIVCGVRVLWKFNGNGKLPEINVQ